jgi:hypothetical protein
VLVAALLLEPSMTQHGVQLVVLPVPGPSRPDRHGSSLAPRRHGLPDCRLLVVVVVVKGMRPKAALLRAMRLALLLLLLAALLLLLLLLLHAGRHHAHQVLAQLDQLQLRGWRAGGGCGAS